jgi:GNAT superfamily N-acetyltransferase
MGTSLRVTRMPSARVAKLAEVALADCSALHTPLLAAARRQARRPDKGALAWIGTDSAGVAGAALLDRDGTLEFFGPVAHAAQWAIALQHVALERVGGLCTEVAALIGHLPGKWRHVMAVDVMATQTRPPDPRSTVEGKADLARPQDSAVVASWIEAFLAETGQEPASHLETAVAAMIDQGDLHLWRIGEEPVSMAAVVARTLGNVRLSLVYTPPLQRRKGYAFACMGALTRRLLDEQFHTCCVHVRPGDSAAVALYAALGYRRLGTRCEAARA